ncbi:MAG: M24 family metallopeptidase [Nitrososphaerota archaeon]|nr:aminopeptidase P family protein [Candidatus Bathyarchaeota archaeon]MCX8162663.1 aminopeptidase P family protein [Candidatus Bathyarchaeota archaeon]MDW8061405.1 M24 family metallopeptidase [Nitrososphaerota archaeon]
MEDILARRLQTLINELKLCGDSYILLMDPSNMLYFTGGETGCLIADYDEAILLIPKLEEEEARSRVGSLLTLEVYGPEDRFTDRMMHIISERKPSTIFFDRLSVRDYEAIRMIVSDLRECMDTVWGMRMKKDPYEVELIAKAAEIACKAMDRVADMLEPGVSEWELAVEAEYIMRKMGAESPAFQTIVASSASSSKPHVKPSSRRIEGDDVVVADLGATYKGYRSDLTRTFLLGSFKQKYGHLLEAVYRAKRRALDTLETGVSSREVDRAARDVIVDLGYGEFFIHGLGHGVGLDIHEPPFLNPISEYRIPENCVLTIEPGIYIPGRIGVRDEDMYIVGEEIRSLTRTSI